MQSLWGLFLQGNGFFLSLLGRVNLFLWIVKSTFISTHSWGLKKNMHLCRAILFYQ